MHPMLFIHVLVVNNSKLFMDRVDLPRDLSYRTFGVYFGSHESDTYQEPLREGVRKAYWHAFMHDSHIN